MIDSNNNHDKTDRAEDSRKQPKQRDRERKNDHFIKTLTNMNLWCNKSPFRGSGDAAISMRWKVVDPDSG